MISPSILGISPTKMVVSWDLVVTSPTRIKIPWDSMAFNLLVLIKHGWGKTL